MYRMKNQTGRRLFASMLVSAATISSAAAAGNAAPLFLTATNGSNNFLAILNTQTKQVSYVPTGGAGGASGNAGGVAVSGRVAAVVNFGSSNVTIFVRHGDAMEPTEVIKTASKPVSAAFGQNHLVVLESTIAESFPAYGSDVGTTADGAVALQTADGSAAQIVTYNGGAMYTEKNGPVAQLNLSTNGVPGLSGPNTLVTLPPAPNNNTPFGLIGRGANVYLTIAHSDLEAVVVNGQIISMAAGPTPYLDSSGNIVHAPCWNALDGHFLFASDSPGKQLLRYLVSDTHVFFDKAGVASLNGPPTDLAAAQNLLGVIDGGDGTTSNASVFDVDGEGELTLLFTVKIAGPINGAAIVE